MACLSSRMVLLVGLFVMTQAARVQHRAVNVTKRKPVVVPVGTGLQEYLVPAMVSKTDVNMHTTQKYEDSQWNVDFGSDGGTVPSLAFRGKFMSSFLGHERLTAYDSGSNQELFQIRMSKAKLNPFQLRHSWRVMPPGAEADDSAWKFGRYNKNVLYTMNMDFFGKGFLWQKPEWRIYRGHRRDGNTAYYCVGKVNPLKFWKWNKGKVECWHSKQDYKTHKSDKSSPPVFTMKQKVTDGFKAKRIVEMIPCGEIFLEMATKMLIMDAYDFWVAPGEDTALLQAFSVVWGWSIGSDINKFHLGNVLPIPDLCLGAK